MPQRSFRAWLIGLALLGASLDQASKYIIFRWLYTSPVHYNAVHQKGEFSVIGDAFLLNVDYTSDPAVGALRTWSSDLMPRVNHGALFGLGNDGKKLFGWEVKPKDANIFFAFVSLIAAAAIIVWSFLPNTTTDRLLCPALGLILGGTLGNLYDRIVFHGVRDFLYVKIIEWPVFNIADCCLVCGAALLLVQAFLTNPAPTPATTPSDSSPEATVATPNVV